MAVFSGIILKYDNDFDVFPVAPYDYQELDGTVFVSTALYGVELQEAAIAYGGPAYWMFYDGEWVI